MTISWKNIIILIVLLSAFGCVSKQSDSLIIARAGINDSPEDIAQKHLGDRDKGWIVRQVNKADSFKPGQQVVIPSRHYDRGGLRVDGAQAVPILVYNGFSSAPAKTRTIVSRQNFIEQMQYLQDNEFHVVSMDDFFDFLDFKKELPKKSVVITVDDGWCSFYEIAYPILKQYGYPVTLFLYTDLIHENSCLSWDQVKEMHQSGVTIGNHSKTHRDLSGPGGKESFDEYFTAVKDEIAEVEQLVKKYLDDTPRYFAYPYGASGDVLIAYLKKKGYRGGFKVSPGANPFYIDRFQIRRSEIYGDYDISRFIDKLNTFVKQKLQ